MALLQRCPLHCLIPPWVGLLPHSLLALKQKFPQQQNSNCLPPALHKRAVRCPKSKRKRGRSSLLTQALRYWRRKGDVGSVTIARQFRTETSMSPGLTAQRLQKGVRTHVLILPAARLRKGMGAAGKCAVSIVSKPRAERLEGGNDLAFNSLN